MLVLLVIYLHFKIINGGFPELSAAQLRPWEMPEETADERGTGQWALPKPLGTDLYPKGTLLYFYLIFPYQGKKKKDLSI